MTTNNFCFYLQNRLIQTSQTGGQWYSDTSPLVFRGLWCEDIPVGQRVPRKQAGAGREPEPREESWYRPPGSSVMKYFYLRH
jgi:hypothetical protein